MIHQLRRTQQLYCDIDTAWNFFSSPANLARITPKNLKFVVPENLGVWDIHEGVTIDYRLSPLLGIPVKWRTIITQVEDKKSFTDYQEKGPYKLWKHFHEFFPNEQGVLMRDSVDYELPLGFLGELVHALTVRKKLEYIFDYRFETLEALFNRKKPEL